MLDHCKSIATRAKLDPTKFDLKTFRSTYATGMPRRGFDVRNVQHWMGHKSLETTMRYLAPATDVHDELDLVIIPPVGKGRPGAAKVRRARDQFPSEARTIACPRRRAGTRRRPKTRYLSIPSLCATGQCWMRWPEWPKRVAPETIDEGRATMQITVELPEDIAVGHTQFAGQFGFPV